MRMAVSQISRSLIQQVLYIQRHNGRTILKQITLRHSKLQGQCYSQVKCSKDISSRNKFYFTNKQSSPLAELSTKNENDTVLTDHSDSKHIAYPNSKNLSGKWSNDDKYPKTEGDHLVSEVTNDYERDLSDYKVLNEEDSDLEAELIPKQQSDLQPIPKQAIAPQFHLAAYVNQSETLTKLVRLGVDLTEVQKVQEAAEKIIKLDFENDVKPYLFFLHDAGVLDADIGKYLSKNPLIFNEDLNDLQARIQYLKSKKFSTEAISRIVSKAHVFLLMPVTTVDAKLGYLQNEYRLTGNEVRSVVTRLPKLISWNLQKLKDNRFYIKEFLGFSYAELTQLMINCPKLFLTDKYSVGKKFDYLHNTMEISHSTLVEWPMIFRTRLHIIQQRHRFLLSVDRAQYDPKKEHFVSLKALVSGTDKEFCKTVAKVSVAQYNSFLKSI